MELNDKIYVAGHNGMVGSAIVRNLKDKGYNNIITRSHRELDLIDQNKVYNFFMETKPDYVFLAAAKVGGIAANNNFPADFIYQNLMIQNNVIHSSYLSNVKKLMFLGSSCIYPKYAPQPMKEDALLTGLLEPTNEPYAIAKIAGIKMCDSYRRQYGSNYISVMPTNLYGFGDNYDKNNSHVLPALIRKFHEAKIANAPYVKLWGTGTPLREFLHADDMADATIFLMQNYNEIGHVNIGSQQELTISELATIVMQVVGYRGDIKFDSDKPDGTPRKLMDSTKLYSMGWRPKIELKDGIDMVYKDVLNRGLF